ncbi:Mbov_0396 family ICE element transmembrane protein [Mycoplasma capricolum]|uniref:Mbov_0396 family ICE element transmembrane protein n=1 Tax=Mycoplasma capricolum TaxID=2095 RepID=UPI003DA62064
MFIDIKGAISDGFWWFFIGSILHIFNGIEKVLNFLIFDLGAFLLFGKSGFRELNWNTIPVPKEFLYFLGFAAIVGLAVFFIQLIKGYFKGGESLKTNFINSIKGFWKATFALLVIPLLLVGITFLFRGVGYLINLIFKNNQETSLTGQLYYFGFRNSYLKLIFLKQFNENSFSAPYHWLYGGDWSPLLSIIATWAGVLTLYKITSTMGTKLLKMFALALISPIPAIMQIRDNGEKLANWKNEFEKIVFGVIGGYFSYFLFVKLWEYIMKIENVLAYSGNLNSTLILILQLGLILGLTGLIFSFSNYIRDLFTFTAVSSSEISYAHSNTSNPIAKVLSYTPIGLAASIIKNTFNARHNRRATAKVNEKTKIRMQKKRINQNKKKWEKNWKTH